MKTIWKFTLSIDDEQTIPMPTGAEVLHVEAQHGCPCLWAAIDTNAPPTLRRFIMRGTGHPMPDFAVRYLGSVQLSAGALVFHIFEQGPTC